MKMETINSTQLRQKITDRLDTLSPEWLNFISNFLDTIQLHQATEEQSRILSSAWCTLAGIPSDSFESKTPTDLSTISALQLLNLHEQKIIEHAKNWQEITVKQRLDRLEKSVTELQCKVANQPASENWLDGLTGSVSDEEMFQQALEYGRELRTADKPGNEASDRD